MSNASTVRRQVSGTQQLTIAAIASQVGVVVNNFVLNNNGLTLAGGGVIPLVAGVTGLYQGTGQVLHIRATGSAVAADTSSSLLLSLWEVPQSVITAGGLTQASQTGFVLVGTSAAVVPGVAGAFAWTFDARLQLDAKGNLSGQFTSDIANVLTIWADISTSLTGLLGEQDLNFVMSATTIATHGLTNIVMNEFALDLE